MTLHTVPYTDESTWLTARAPNINSTDAAALLGLSPYQTLYGLWHVKRRGADDGFKPSDRTRWGQALQDVIAMRVMEDYGVVAEPMREYMYDDAFKMGASFDYKILKPSGLLDPQERFTLEGPGILEIKNVDRLQFRKGWLDDETEEAPEHIEIQLQMQLFVSGLKWGVIAALVGGNELRTFLRESDPEFHAILRRKIGQFWSMPEPLPEYPADADTVRRLHQSISGEEIADLTRNNALADACARYKAASAVEKQAAEDKSVASAEVLAILGERKGALAAGFKITSWVVDEAEVKYLRKSFRSMRITEMK
jgi:putative phage-type endonuclease